MRSRNKPRGDLGNLQSRTHPQALTLPTLPVALLLWLLSHGLILPPVPPTQIQSTIIHQRRFPRQAHGFPRRSPSNFQREKLSSRHQRFQVQHDLDMPHPRDAHAETVGEVVEELVEAFGAVETDGGAGEEGQDFGLGAARHQLEGLLAEDITGVNAWNEE